MLQFGSCNDHILPPRQCKTFSWGPGNQKSFFSLVINQVHISKLSLRLYVCGSWYKSNCQIPLQTIRSLLKGGVVRDIFSHFHPDLSHPSLSLTLKEPDAGRSKRRTRCRLSSETLSMQLEAPSPENGDSRHWERVVRPGAWAKKGSRQLESNSSNYIGKLPHHPS